MVRQTRYRRRLRAPGLLGCSARSGLPRHIRSDSRAVGCAAARRERAAVFQNVHDRKAGEPRLQGQSIL